MFRHIFYFPRIVHVKAHTIYRLDWSKFEEMKEKDYLSWVDRYWKDKMEPYWPGSLPQKWADWCDGLLFNLDVHYLSEIRRNAMLGMVEYGTYRSFDTVIREMCYETGRAFIGVAFKLLADCVVDEDGKWKRPDKWIALPIMLLRFWSHQTGRGLIWSMAGLDEIEREIDDGVILDKELLGLYEEMLGDLRPFCHYSFSRDGNKNEMDRAYDNVEIFDEEIDSVKRKKDD